MLNDTTALSTTLDNRQICLSSIPTPRIDYYDGHDLSDCLKPVLSLLGVIFIILVAFLFVMLQIIQRNRREWTKCFSARYSRRSPQSPSNTNRPAVVKKNRHDFEYQDGAGSDKNKPQKVKSSRRKSHNRSSSLTPETVCHSLSSNEIHDNSEKSSSCKHVGSINIGSLSQTKQGTTLDMDHVYMEFKDFLLFKLFVYPSLSALAIIGMMSLKIRVFLHNIGLIKPQPHDPAETAAKLILEQTLAIYFKGFAPSSKKSDKEEEDIAVFEFERFLIIDCNSGDNVPGVRSVDSFRVEIDVKSEKKTVVGAWLDNEPLSPSECVILVQWFLYVVSHPKSHAMANWAVNLEKEQQKSNPDLAWDSIVTTGYNYMGFSGFPRSDPVFRCFGLLSKSNTSVLFLPTWHVSLQSGVPEHSKVTQLVHHSKFVKFLVGVRQHFLREFSKHKECCFPGCDGEALFVGTVIHSLEHSLNVRNFRDTLWLDVDCPKYGYMAELLRIIRVAFVDDLPFIPFNQRMKDSQNPFYQSVYAKASTINVDFADMIDTCIVK